MRADRNPVSHAGTRICSRSPSPLITGSSARTRPSSSAASIAGPTLGVVTETSPGARSRSPGMALMLAARTDIGRVIQRVITR